METIIEMIWKPKTSLLLVETVFQASEKHFFFAFVRYSWLRKQFFSQMETYFLTSSSFRLVDMVFLSSGNSILLFRALLKFLKFGGSNFFQEKPYSCSWKLIFWVVEVNFFHFSDTLAS